MKKLRFQWIYFVVGIFLVVVLSVFQNCSKTSFTSVASSETADPSLPSNAGPTTPSTRTKTITPTTSEQANPGKVKALIVIDNSGSMGASQQNLSQTINPLLAELEKNNAEIRIASTTLSSNECAVNNDENCKATALFTHSQNYNNINNSDGSQNSTASERLTLNAPIDFKYVEGTTQSQKNIVTENIVSKINSFGIRGSNSESPFAAIAINAIDQNYFQQNDKALIFVVTDEDDSVSINKLITPKYSYSSRTLTRQNVPGIAVRVSGYMYSGSCTYSGENGNSNSGPLIGPIVGQTLAACNAWIATIPNCSYSCSYTVQDNPSNGEGYELGAREFNSACSEFQANILPQQKFESCVSKDHVKVTETNPFSERQWHLGITEESYATLSQLQTVQLKNHFVQKLKERLEERVGEKYLIQVATNIPNQSCGLTGEYQSNDTFFRSIANQFPSQNYKVSSICSQDGTSAESIRKLASDFISVVNSEYALGLLPNERIISVKLKLKDRAEIFELVAGTQYEIRDGQFKLLDTSLTKFEKIEIEIKSN